MDLRSVSTAELARELLSRAEHIDALLSLVDAARTAPAAAPTASNGTHRPRGGGRGRTRVRALDVEDALREAGRPLTAPELMRKLNATSGVVSGHLRRAVALRRVVTLGAGRPRAYALSGTLAAEFSP
jgi:hypothetical protein